MPGFADSFWSGDYAGGLGVLFGKLQQGVVENQQVLTIASMRADAEEAYGDKMEDIAPAVDKLTGGFNKDEGASVRKAYEGVRNEMVEASKSHHKIASNIRELVVNPFSRWCAAHSARVQNSQDDLQTRIKAHDKQADVVRKLRSQYFNKCRMAEDLEEENKLAFQEPEKPTSPKPLSPPIIKLPEDSDEEEPEIVEIGDEEYSPEKLKAFLTDMLNNIKLGEAKVPILGTYLNVSTGSDIVDYLREKKGASSVSYAERIGQDLVSTGFLRLVGNVGRLFANSSKMNYQWRTKAFLITGIPEKKKELDRVSSISSAAESVVDSPLVGSVGEMLAGWNPLNNAHPNETPAEKLKREAKEADDRYKAGVRKLDLLRCNLEESIVDHLKFMERCELDRLKAIKAVILDFSGAISNVIPSLQSTVDNMMLYQETVQPLGDLRYLLENYRTGAFIPKVQVYDNYYNSVDEQSFGVDLEARARADRKRVPIIITTILTFLDNHYPDLEGDEARRSIWLVEVPLAATHHLRNVINNGSAVPREVLERYEIPIVASVLKLYLLELPDSLVSNQVYEIIKSIYSTAGSPTAEEARITVLQNTLGQLRLANIATLDAIVTHFTRLIELTSADEEYISALAHSLSPCILRPRTETTLTMQERHAYRLLRDLFAHKDAIFGELKRQSSHSSHRPRGMTDESSRRAAMEERQRAIASRSRASSPAPPRHRRDRSVGNPSDTRFPINPSGAGSPSTASSSTKRSSLRNSLDVPGAVTMSATLSSPPADAVAFQNGTGADHTHTDSDSTTTSVTSPVTTSTTASSFQEKRNSLGRSAIVGRGGRRGTASSMGGSSLKRQSFPQVEGADGVANRGSVDSLERVEETSPAAAAQRSRGAGVQLVDKPMDD
ncbi:MAG: hypothetical protein M1834_005512 [Cirrosporium novae-zelandiae]|nr:MAG: hypothetical protein M1834_005512 [Cirrosporium novae-zelandiae]